MPAELTTVTEEPVEWSVAEARNKFSDAVNRAAFGGEITFITRGRNHHRAAAIVPAELVELYESMVDAQLGKIATQRLADINSVTSTLRSETLSVEEFTKEIGL